MLRIILFVANAGAAIICFYAIFNVRYGSVQFRVLPVAALAVLLVANAVFVGPAAKRLKDSQILHLIRLWLDSKEGELERRREQAEKPK